MNSTDFYFFIFQSQSKGFEEKEKELARQIEQLEKEAQRSFEAEELAARYKDELDALSASKVTSTEEPESSKDAETIAKLQVCALITVLYNKLYLILFFFIWKTI